MSDAPRPGWYPDPAGASELFRWWDGTSWAQVTSNRRDAAPPLAVETPAPSRPVPARSPVHRVVAVTVGFALFLTASVGVGLVIWRDPSLVTPVSGGAGGPSAPTGQLDEKSRLASIGPASMTLPDSPYVLHQGPLTVAGWLDLAFVASAPVHRDYRGTDDWPSTVLLGQLTHSSDRLDEQARDALRMMCLEMFDQHRTSVSGERWQDHSVDGYVGTQVTARVHYRVPGVPSSYDTVTVLAVQLDDGSVVVALSSVPNDAEPAAVRAAAQALTTLSVS